MIRTPPPASRRAGLHVHRLVHHVHLLGHGGHHVTHSPHDSHVSTKAPADSSHSSHHPVHVGEERIFIRVPSCSLPLRTVSTVTSMSMTPSLLSPYTAHVPVAEEVPPARPHLLTEHPLEQLEGVRETSV